MHRISATRPPNEFSQKDLFLSYYPNSYLQADYMEFDGMDFMVIVDTLTGFGRVYKSKNKGTDKAIRTMRVWIAQFGRPVSLHVDSGPGFRDKFGEELRKLGVAVQHSSANSPQSNSHCGYLSQLELD